ncbi:MAG: hypothetical protein RJA36_920 [Pseudomonadota bacterium]|jgi:hypothetical protein
MKPAELVIHRFGGVRPLARLLKVNPSTVQRWKMPAARGGLDGRVPSARMAELLRLAVEQKIILTASELIEGAHCTGQADESTSLTQKEAAL